MSGDRILDFSSALLLSKTEAIGADEFWSFVKKNIHHCQLEELEAGDCWIGLSLAQTGGLILSARVGKHKARVYY